MTQKKLWTKQQDEVLRHLRQDQGLKKWSEIARRMKARFGKNSRNQKQCRDRYINHLRISKDLFQWKKEDEDRMIELHHQFGNKWAAIAQKFTGITENFIKNQFYSRMRKSIRKINKFISQKLKKEFKQLKLNLIFKLASMVDGKLKKFNGSTPQLNVAYSRFLYSLLSYTSEPIASFFQNGSSEQNFVILLIRPLLALEQIFHCCSKRSKKRSKQVKLSSMRFNSQMQLMAQEVQKSEEELNKKIQDLSRKAISQLKELDEWEIVNFSQETRKWMGKSPKGQSKQNSRKQQDEKEQNSLNDEISVSRLSNQIQSHKQKNSQNPQNLKTLKSPLKPFNSQDDLSSIIQEESQIREMLYEQSPRSISFIVDHWNNSEQSEMY